MYNSFIRDNIIINIGHDYSWYGTSDRTGDEDPTELNYKVLQLYRALINLWMKLSHNNFELINLLFHANNLVSIHHYLLLTKFEDKRWINFRYKKGSLARLSLPKRIIIFILRWLIGWHFYLNFHFPLTASSTLFSYYLRSLIKSSWIFAQTLISLTNNPYHSGSTSVTIDH